MTALEAHGGKRGGAGRRTGEQVVVRFADGVLDIFTEANSIRYHAALIDAIELAPSPAPTGEQLRVAAARHGCAIPVRFEGAQREAMERIIAAVRGS